MPLGVHELECIVERHIGAAAHLVLQGNEIPPSKVATKRLLDVLVALHPGRLREAVDEDTPGQGFSWSRRGHEPGARQPRGPDLADEGARSRAVVGAAGRGVGLDRRRRCGLDRVAELADQMLTSPDSVKPFALWLERAEELGEDIPAWDYADWRNALLAMTETMA